MCQLYLIKFQIEKLGYASVNLHLQTLIQAIKQLV